MPPLLSVERARYAFAGDGGFRLAVPALQIEPGRTAGCIGPSGCGKSTMLQLLAGILLPHEGVVALDGVPWSRLSAAERRARRLRHIGLVFQEFELLDYLTVSENILLPYAVAGQAGPRHDAGVDERLALLARAAGIEPLLGRRPRALSQGERQRAALCRALITQPRVILADEPTGNLDPHTARAVLELMLTQVRQRSTALVMVTHDHTLLGAFDEVVELALEPGGARAAPRAEPLAARRDNA